MKKLSFIYLLVTSVLLFSATGCDDDENFHINGEFNSSLLVKNILNNNDGAVKSQIKTYIESGVIDSPDSPFPDYGNVFEKLVSSLNKNSKIDVTKNCYNCIYTYPPMSEIKLCVTEKIWKKNVHIDISCDEENNIVVYYELLEH